MRGIRSLKILLISCLLASMLRGQEVPAQQRSDSSEVKPPSVMNVDKGQPIELGILEPNKNYVFLVPFRNITDNALLFYGYRTSCYCAKITSWDDDLPPKSSTWLEVFLHTPGTETDLTAAITVQTFTKGRSLAKGPEFEDTLSFRMMVRNVCSFIPEHPILPISHSDTPSPVTLRAVNYGHSTWRQPVAQLDIGRIQPLVQDRTESIDGVERQVLVITVDTGRIATHLSDKKDAPKKALLRVFAVLNGNDALQQVGDKELTIVHKKTISVYPNMIHWSLNRPKDVSLVVVCHKPLSKSDVVVSTTNGSGEPIDFEMETINSYWFKLVVPVHSIRISPDPQAGLRISIPKHNYATTVGFRISGKSPSKPVTPSKNVP